MGMYPDADVPVLEVSIPTFDPESLFEIGNVLSPLRDEGVMIMGAGLMTHSRKSMESNRAFDAWVVERLQERDAESLLRYQELAPGVHEALPTVEHFVPLLLAYGAAYEGAGTIIDGVSPYSETGGIKRSLQFN